MRSLTATMIKEINRQILQISPEINERSLGGFVRDSAVLDFLIEELEQIEDLLKKQQSFSRRLQYVIRSGKAISGQLLYQQMLF